MLVCTLRASSGYFEKQYLCLRGKIARRIRSLLRFCQLSHMYVYFIQINFVLQNACRLPGLPPRPRNASSLYLPTLKGQPRDCFVCTINKQGFHFDPYYPDACSIWEL